MQHIMITANDSPGLIGKISSALERFGMSIEQILIDRTDEEKSLVDIDLYVRIHQHMSSKEKVMQAIAEIDGIKQIVMPSET
nr:ACT domain-containing protein [Alicyclobacillus hesperidum]